MKDDEHDTCKKARILIVDDCPLIREGLSAHISSQSDLMVCGEASGAREALACLRTTTPDLVVIDFKLKNGHGLELIKEIRMHDERIKVLVLTSYDESLYAERALRAGALGYLNKIEPPIRFLEAIRTVLAGRRCLSEEMTRRLVEQAVAGRDKDAATDPVQRLSNRELEVFELIGQGLATSAIAKRLHLSVHTIESHREKIRHKLRLRDGSDLVRHAVQWVLENQ